MRVKSQGYNPCIEAVFVGNEGLSNLVMSWIQRFS